MKRFLTAIALLGILGLPLYAQDAPKAELFGGYQFIHDSGINLSGFNAAIEGNISKNVGIVGDLTYGRNDTFGEFNFLGGPRISYRTDKVRIFGEALLGLVRVGTPGQRDNGFGFAFGGGVDFALNEKVSIRPVRFDFLEGHVKGEWGNQILYSAGIVFKFGTKSK